MRCTGISRNARRRAGLIAGVAVIAAPAVLLAPSSTAFAGANDNGKSTFQPNKVLVSLSTWQQAPAIAAGMTQLPPGCSHAPKAPNPCATAVAGGDYPFTFNNDQVDGSFGITQPIVLEQINPSSGKTMVVLVVPNSTTTSGDQLVTSFSSKSEMALNQSTDGSDVTFMGYVAPVAAIDVSNSNTPGAVDPTNSGGTTPFYRAVADVDRGGQFQFTQTNAYSGNNGRAAVLNSSNDSFYTVGNAGNGANPEPQGVVEGAGSQIMASSTLPESEQSTGAPTPLANFNVKQLGLAADKSAKDNNFRGLTVSNGVIYTTKGSGSNGVDTVYFLDPTGTACPTGGVGVPSTGATLPSATTWISPTFTTSDPALGLTMKNPGLSPTNTCILSGFPTTSAKESNDASLYPFGIWFANPDTLYVADEGAGDAAFSNGMYLPRRPIRPPLRFSSEMGVQRNQVEPGVHHPVRPKPRRPLPGGQRTAGSGLPHGREHLCERSRPNRRPGQLGHRQRWSAQPHRSGERQRHRDPVGYHVDSERKRRSGRRPELAGDGHRQTGGHVASCRRQLHARHLPHLGTGRARRVVHPGNQIGAARPECAGSPPARTAHTEGGLASRPRKYAWPRSLPERDRMGESEQLTNGWVSSKLTRFLPPAAQIRLSSHNHP